VPERLLESKHTRGLQYEIGRAFRLERAVHAIVGVFGVILGHVAVILKSPLWIGVRFAALPFVLHGADVLAS
jgi:hypothetical protein